MSPNQGTLRHHAVARGAARRTAVLPALVAAILLAPAAPDARQDDPPRRIVSVVPAVTEMLFAIGAGPRVAGVSSFARHPPEVETLPRVGALLDPDVERILSLRPDLVILYGSQTDTVEQMARGSIPVFPYRHGTLAGVMTTMRELGAATGREAAAERLAHRMEADLAAIRNRVSRRPRPRVLLVLGREPDAIRNVYASGGAGFLHDAIVAAGGRNVFAGTPREAVQPGSERILASAPDVIVEVHAEGLLEPADAARQPLAWGRLASVPAVRHGRIHVLAGDDLVVPGPRLVDGVARLARLFHPDAFE